MTFLTTTRAVLFILLFGAGVQAQTLKIGDYVDADRLMLGRWEPCKISQPLSNGQYGVSCGPKQADLPVRSVRPRAATAEDKRIEAETAAALARQPHGQSVGAKYGTRDPKTCSNRTVPAKGAPSAEQARQYFICDQEHEVTSSISLVTNVKAQVAPVSHAPNQIVKEIHAADIDPSQPVWDIRGSFTQYQCTQLTAIPGWPTNVNDFARTHNCNATDQTTATGYCYKNTFGDWHCGMLDVAHVIANTRQYQLPPEGN